MLKISNVETFYGKIQALRGVDLDVNDGEIVSLIGSNGAGKSTLLMTISGVNKAKRGNIVFNGENIENKQPHKIVDMGICQVPEGRRIFSRLTVEENLRLGAHANEKGKYFENDIKEVYDLFPVLSDRKTQRGGTLSGGEQQMLAIGRALMSKPKVLLLDEPSLGIAPKLVNQIFSSIKNINKEISCEQILSDSYSISSLNNFEKNKFKDLLIERYPKYDQMFQEASDETMIDKNLLAAISFQESQWDPRAQSNMGVRGMMMVTLETAALVGVEKRLNPEQNIKGGSRYFAMLLEKNKVGITEADKLSIVLASYNLGPTNILKVASLIDENIENVSWLEIEEKLKTLKGEDLNLTDSVSYTRGQQAIDYVGRVKEYYQLMSAHSCVQPKDQLIFF